MAVLYPHFIFRMDDLWSGDGHHMTHLRSVKDSSKPHTATPTTSSSNSSASSSSSRSRIAYLITVDASSKRSLRSKQVLERAGFDVQFEVAPTITTNNRLLPDDKHDKDDKVLSNKRAQLSIYHKIATDHARPWGYIFEDDILLSCKSPKFSWFRWLFIRLSDYTCRDEIDFSVEHDIVAGNNFKNKNVGGMETRHLLAMYLGIFRPEQQQKDLYCGRCAHAYGLSKLGAKKLLEFDCTYQDSRSQYLDVVMESWCRQEGGFPVSHAKYRSHQNPGHYGAFFQDRRTFQSLIG